MWIDAFITMPEIAEIVEAAISKHGAHGLVFYGRTLPVQRWELGQYKSLLAPPEASQVLVRNDSFDIRDATGLVDRGKLEGWVVVNLPNLHFDLLRECSVLYGDEERLPGVSSSLPIFKTIRNEIKKVATVPLRWEHHEVAPNLRCSVAAAALHDAGINLVIGRPDDKSRFFHPVREQ